MASTPVNRLRLTPSNSPFLSRPSRSPLRGRHAPESRLSLTRVVGTTCSSPTGFDSVQSLFAYVAGGAVVVIDVDGDQYTQRFYRARPSAVPLHATSPRDFPPTNATSTPKANDSRNRVALGQRDSPFGASDWSESPSGKTWTSRERIKAATCLALSRDAKFLAVGETGYSPRVLIFGLQDSSSDVPLVSINEHAFGVQAVAWSQDTRFLASLGTPNDGFLYIWKIDPRTGAAKLSQQNRCTSSVRGMVWMGNYLITFGVRHVKFWRVEETPSVSPVKQKFGSDSTTTTPQTQQKALPGRNILLGSLIDSAFTCATVVDDGRAVLCTDAGDVCLLEDDGKQMKLQRVLRLDFSITSITLQDLTALVGGKDGQFATLNVTSVVDFRSDCVITKTQSPTGLVALGFMGDESLVTIDAKHSINVWGASYIPGQSAEVAPLIPIPGHGEPIVGVQLLSKPNPIGASFITWSGSGKLMHWTLDGQVVSTMNLDFEQTPFNSDLEVENQVTAVWSTKSGDVVYGDRRGVLRAIDFETKTCILDTKAHSSDCTGITMYESDDRFIMASFGRDRTTQLFHRRPSSGGPIEHFQTLEFAAKVVKVIITQDKIFTCSLDRTLQVLDLVAKEGQPEVMAAIPSRVISLKASPTCMTMGPDDKTIFVSLLDRSISQFEVSTGRVLMSFKCTDESGIESAVLDSLILGQCHNRDLLLAVSNTDKSVRVYDAQTGYFLDREWGHTEAINGIALVQEDGCRKVVSVGSDSTVMVWSLDLQEPSPGSSSRDPSPVKEGVSSRPPLRRVLSRAELSEFQRQSPTSGAAGRRSPPRSIQRRSSRQFLSCNANLRTPTATQQMSPADTIAEGTPSRRTSLSRPGSPPPSPKARVTRRPSLPALNMASRKKSTPNLRSFGSLSMATEQTCRTLRAYRKKLSSTEPISQEVLTELDQELRLTASALGDRAVRSKTLNESMFAGLLDQYSEILAAMLDEKLAQSGSLRRDSRDEELGQGRGQGRGEELEQSPEQSPEPEQSRQRPKTAGGETS
ncbi:related to transcriptional repressor rco-1 [Cephalotrichum gorgonifer]|uniref:Related to transcriptional repressor rco-1 n=1 Tax=Cephalotrichum gorgonifer TaxID=2041049 RepID=A0AAE8SW67_9PEZI|nr:related to transcriptional repressor rco-1 [Cephalotrichum gorgonifer]